jgi:signal transduction histidine kinase/DNA-binding response OmpR family regulator
MGITAKTAMLSWLVTIVTLAIFVAVIIPQQKRTFQENLNSKARGICASLQDVTAGAIVTEDYSSVVDHCRQVLQGDESIDFLIITKNDGFSLINESGATGPQREPRWRMETLDTSWRPSERTVRGGIGTVPLFNRRVFHYEKPFDYSGIEWGWIHVGLSLDAYDRSVRDVYIRTVAMATFCLLIGLIASVLYARRIVSPVLSLEHAVRNVASGDLSIRADIRTGDEVEGLARAFNTMTDAVERREARLRAQNQAMTVLATKKSLHDGDMDAAVRVVTETAADILKVSRSSIWLLSEDGTTLTCVDLYESANRAHSNGIAMKTADYPAYFQALDQAPTLAVRDAQTDPRTREFTDRCLAPLGIKSVLNASIRLGGRIVGVMCEEHNGEPRDWSLEEQNCVGSLADLVALALEAQDRRRTRNELVAAKEAAEAANKAKSQFLANMSHEIRTPINGVVGMLQLMKEVGLPDRQQRYLETALTATDTLLTVINDILDFSKIEAGKLDLEIRDFNLRQVVDDIVGTFAAKAAEKGLDLACAFAPDVPSVVRGDDRRLGQVLMNLVGNALKFTKQGEVVVRVNVDGVSKADALLRFTVKDSGIGIASEPLRILFNPFVQADNSTTRRFGGTGLGLAISRQLAKLMGGEIGVESQEGKGSTFWFTLRVVQQGEADVGVEERAHSLKGLRVLVVDDHAATREIVRTYLEAWGCMADAAENGPAALTKLRQTTRSGTGFDVVLIDEFMPAMDGTQLAGRIAEDADLAGTGLVLLAPGGTSSGAVKQPFAAKAGKPVRQSNLYNALVTAANGHLSRVAHESAPSGPRAAETTGIRILVAEDNEINQTLITEILTMMGHHFQCVCSGKTALAELKNQSYDLVLMDCQMPEMDGYEAARAIRRWEKEQGAARRLPIIALTAHAMKGDRDRCMEAGMDDYLQKPLDVQEFRMAVARWLPTRR